MSLENKFSKDLAGDLRRETADKLRKARNKPSDFETLKKEVVKTGDLSEEYSSWNDLPENFEMIKKDFFGKIFKTEKYRKHESFLEETLKVKKEYDIKKIKKEYQKKFDEVMARCPLNEEEKEKYLSTENLKQMPLNDYLTLLKRLSGEAFYHVTRYGVRENTFTSTGGGHSEGEGKFVDSFTPLLADGKINSFLSTIISDEENVKRIINPVLLKDLKDQGMSPDEATDMIIKSYYNTSYVLDRESAHFSYGRDLHHMYGGENGYKFYFYYPVEYMLQNEFFHSTREPQINIGDGYCVNREGISQQYNDFEIFNYGQGVPIDAGILCIDGSVEVDPKNGSQYLLEENGKPVLDDNKNFVKPDQTISSKEYWEKYFKLHPELEPSKVMYENFSTYADSKDEDLNVWANKKNIYNQADDIKDKFSDYESTTREALRKIIGKAIREEYENISVS
jgi:hypothetical protein